MTITLSYLTTTLALPEDLYWSDENDWHPVEQSVQRTITGSLIVNAATRTGGRPITLQPLDESSAWMYRELLDTLRSWGAVAGRTMTLTLRGVSRSVIFRHQDGAAIEALPIIHYNDVNSADFYLTTLRFQEV